MVKLVGKKLTLRIKLIYNYMKNLINTAELLKLIEEPGQFDDFTEQDIAKEYVNGLDEYEGALDEDGLTEWASQWADNSTPVYHYDILGFYRESIGHIYLIEDAQKEMGATGIDSLMVGICMLRNEIAGRVNNLILKGE